MILVIGPPRDFPKQVPGHDDFGQLERDIAAMAHDRGPDLDHPVACAAPRLVYAAPFTPGLRAVPTFLRPPKRASRRRVCSHEMGQYEGSLAWHLARAERSRKPGCAARLEESN